MKERRIFYKQLTPAEAGDTKTHEKYVRFPNDFDYVSFFGKEAFQNENVLQLNIDAFYNGNYNEPIKLKFVYYANSNKEKRIPSLSQIFDKYNVKAGDSFCLVVVENDSNTEISVSFKKPSDLKLYSSHACYRERVVDEEYKHKNLTAKYAPLQQILFGAPGTGKSHTLKNDANITEKNSIRTTFHPDSDYSTFVGCYKPTKDEERGEITYDFTPQAFTNAYIAAWKDLDNPFFLIIEEINRGNCAQVFGDIFQLLDRDEYGYSSYKTTPDQDLANYIRKQLDDADIDDAEVKSGKKMQLPPNLHIWATMNTSDQSLFPIDSAFKRRWDWRYIPIDYTDRGHYIACGDTQYSWADFLQKVNERVESVTMSEDKKLGYWFTGNGLGQKEIAIDRFVSKVVFYLWNDVFKDFGRSGNTIFKDSFSKFHLFFDFSGKPKVEIVKAFLDALEVKSGETEASNPEDGTSSNGIDYTKYTFDGQTKLSKKALGEKIVMKYLEQNPNLTFDQIKGIFAFDDAVVSKEQYKGIIAKSEDVTGSYVPSYGTEQTSIDGVKFKVLTWWNKYNIDFIIKFAEAQGWSVIETAK